MNDSAGSASSHKKKKGVFSVFSIGRRCRMFYVIAVFLMATVVASCWLLGTSAAKHLTFSRRYRDAKTALLISSAIVAVGEEAVALSLGKPCSDVCGNLDAKLDALKKAGNKESFNLVLIQEYIEEGRGLYADQSATFKAAMLVYNRATFFMSDGLRVLMGKQADDGYAGQVGLLCILQTIISIFNRFTLQYPPLLARWGLEEYREYVARAASEYMFPTCAPYLPGVSSIDVVGLLAEGPKVTGVPPLTYGSIPELKEAAFQRSIRELADLAEAYNQKTRDYWQKQMVKLSVIIALSTLSALIATVSLCFMPYFIASRGSRSDAAIEAQYHKVDSKAKLIPQFAHYISTLKGENHLHAFLKDSFLCKIEGFVDRVRPLIPQTCFGDVEGVAFTDTGEVAQARDEAGLGGVGASNAAAGSEDEHRVLELRGDVGLQVAFGTFMCVSVSACVKQGKKTSNEEQVNRLVAAVEEIVNARHGVVHSIAGDYIFVAWNVVRPCYSSEVNGFLSALELAHRFHNNLDDVSISLSSSPAIAGNFNANAQLTSVVLGPGQARCEKLEMLNAYLGTCIAMDEAVARKISGITLSVQNVCVVPAAVYRCVTGLEKGPYDIAYAVYPSALKERHKAWVSAFRDFPSLLLAKKVDEVMDQVVAFKNTYLQRRPAGKGGDGVSDPCEMTKTVDYWITFLSRVKLRYRSKDATI